MSNRPRRALFDTVPLISPEQAAADAEWVRQHVADGTLARSTNRLTPQERRERRERGYELIDQGATAQEVAAITGCSPKTAYGWVEQRKRQKNRPPKKPPLKVQRAAELRELGWTDERIVQHLGISGSTIRRHLGPSPSNTHVDPERKAALTAQARYLRERGWSLRQIGAEIGIYHHTVGRWIRGAQ